VVEDVPAGIRAGKAAGARVIACRTTASEAELEDAGADWIVDGCKSISVSQANGKLRLILTDEHVIQNP
jgi:glycerol 3-phosphatase-1